MSHKSSYISFNSSAASLIEWTVCVNKCLNTTGMVFRFLSFQMWEYKFCTWVIPSCICVSPSSRSYISVRLLSSLQLLPACGYRLSDVLCWQMLEQLLDSSSYLEISLRLQRKSLFQKAAAVVTLQPSSCASGPVVVLILQPPSRLSVGLAGCSALGLWSVECECPLVVSVGCSDALSLVSVTSSGLVPFCCKIPHRLHAELLQYRVKLSLGFTFVGCISRRNLFCTSWLHAKCQSGLHA